MGGKRTTAPIQSVVNHNYTRKSYNPAGYKSFEEFYPFYLGEHCHRTNRRLHLIGTTNFIILALLFVILTKPLFLLLGVLQGYGLAWIGHFLFEKNRPATFKHPVYSVYKQILIKCLILNSLKY
jgi:hypothetical protein